jgi:uncharacterized protein YcbX
VAGLVYYPVKGCAGIQVSAAEVLTEGLRHDREFVIVDTATGEFRTQRTLPRLATIRVEITGPALLLSAPGVPELEIPIQQDGVRRQITVWSHTGEGVDQGAAAAGWFGAVLGLDVRLVRTPPDHHRPTTGLHNGYIRFADGHPVLLASLSSLDCLNDRLCARGAEPIPMDRFRPNVIVSGWPEPHTEDRVHQLSAGGVRLGHASRCKRCAVPTVDQHTGERTGPEPTRTLADYRRDSDRGGVTFAANAAVLTPGTITVGDPITVHSWL